MISLVLMAALAQAGAVDGGSVAAEEVKPNLLAPEVAEVPQPKATTTLKALLDASQENNVDRRITQAQVDKADADFLAAWSGLLPAITAQGSFVHNQYDARIPAGAFGPNEIVIQPQDQLTGQGRVDLPLIDTQKWFRSAAASASKDGAREREFLTRDQVNRAVISTWYSYANSLGVKQSAEKSKRAAEVQLKLQDIRARAGAATELELVRARAEVARNNQLVADATRLIAIGRRNLQTLTGVDPGPAADLPADDTTAPAELGELEKHVLDVPAVKAAEKDYLAAERIANAARTAIVPTVGAQFTEQLTNFGGFTGRNAIYNTGLYFSWRLDVPTFANMASQSAAERTAGLALEKAKLAARDQINADWQTVQAALTKLSAATSQVQASQRAQQVASVRYQAGAATQLDVITADRDLFQAEVQQISARTELASARLSLQISTAQPLDVR